MVVGSLSHPGKSENDLCRKGVASRNYKDTNENLSLD
jgi:hypothetical protein